MTAMYKGEQYSCALRADQRVKVSHTPRQQLIPLQVKGDFLPILSFCSTHIGSHSVKHTPDQVITLNRQKMFQNQNPLQIRKQLCSLCPSGLFSFNNTGMIPFFPLFLLHIFYTVFNAPQKHLYQERKQPGLFNADH